MSAEVSLADIGSILRLFVEGPRAFRIKITGCGDSDGLTAVNILFVGIGSRHVSAHVSLVYVGGVFGLLVECPKALGILITSCFDVDRFTVVNILFDAIGSRQVSAHVSFIYICSIFR